MWSRVWFTSSSGASLDRFGSLAETPPRARRRLAPWGDHLEVIPYAHAAEYLEGCQLVINATPLGAGASDALPIASEQVDGLVHWDLVYRREATTPWVAHALQRGQLRWMDA